MIRALKAYIPELEVYLGHFLSHEVFAPLANPTLYKRSAKVIRTEEKGSDVNMAVHFINDAWLDRYDCGIIVSNDSDLAQAMSLVKHQQKKVLGLITPSKGKTSKELRIHADFVRHIRPGALQTSQLPAPIPGTSLCKPSRW